MIGNYNVSLEQRPYDVYIEENHNVSL